MPESTEAPRSTTPASAPRVRVRLSNGRTAVVDSTTARHAYAALEAVVELVTGVSRGAAGQR